MRQADLPATALLLDPNNYRFHELEHYVEAAEDRFAEDAVQKRAQQRLRQEEGIQELKNSIVRNGYIPVERIVVRPYAHAEGKYVVVEGNRRTAAVKWILDDQDAGVNIPQATLNSIANLPVVIVEEAAPDEIFRASLMGIRHVSGIRQWGGYQRAKLVAHMRDALQLESGEVSDRLGMSTNEANRRYRAFQALRQMQMDEEFADFANPSMYAIFHEAVSLTAVKAWLDWRDVEGKFCNEETRTQFYELITPREDDEGHKLEPKITSYSQVRELRSILDKPEAKRILLDPSRPFVEALGIAKQEEFARLWVSAVAEAISSLESLGVKELKDLQQAEVDSLNKLRNLASERLNDYTALTGKQV
ncbi:ParB N-terminal domain-containing protein [Nitrogeniibacter aestuarii]|uniref:ParB N-terminal domain-containing protein n=1 Tax=Nitrogeniibacter aestuarii TaxID=2815343 RepID=UPI001E2C4D71|nr:ParB N-terminal domain-containing protein [Nitrogeniibacter aestuarii]